MHEAGMVKSLVQMTLEAAGGRPVRRVVIAAAQCARVEEEAVRFYWRQFAVGTPAADAEVQVRQVPFVNRCPGCGRYFAATEAHAACPHCGTHPTAALLGPECVLLEEVVVAEPPGCDLPRR